MDSELTSTPIKYPNFVTHAHSDHTAALSSSSLTYLTKITQDLYDVTAKRRAKNYSHLEFNKPIEIGNLEIEFLNAGHLLGASQVLVREGTESFLYTGDFCPEDLMTVKGAHLPKENVDLTIIDSTYGDDMIFFETRTKSRQDLFFWIIKQLNEDKIPVINVGHIGGAQEIISLINELTSGNLPILVGNKIKRVNDIYQKNDVELQYFELSDPSNHDLLHGKCVILVPRSFKNVDEMIKTYPALNHKLVRCIVTGQSAIYGFYSFDYTSSLSTHAHYTELIEVTKQLNPKHILTHYGHHKKFAKSLVNDHQYSAESFETAKPIEIKSISNQTPVKPIKKRKKTKEEREFGFTPLDHFLSDY